MDAKKILLEVLGGKIFKRVPLNSTVYYFHFSWLTNDELSVLIGDSNTDRGRGLIEAYIYEENGNSIFALDDHKYSLNYIGISFDGERKCEVRLTDLDTKEELRLREEGPIK